MRLFPFFWIFIFFLPIVAALQTITVNENDIVRLNPSAFDPDHDELRYVFTEPINTSGEWKTKTGDAGIYNVSVLVTDGGYVIENIVIIVNGSNHPPTMEFIENITVKEGEELFIQVYADDPDGDNLSIMYAGWINKGRYTTKYDEAGLHTVTVTVSDGIEEVWQDVFVNVIDANRAPTILSPDEITANEGETIIILPDAIDLDGDTITYSYTGWMDTNSYTTTFKDAGVHDVRIYANDGKTKAYKDIKITVKNVNRPPVIENLSMITVPEGHLVEINPVIYDPDGDELFISYSGFMNKQNYKTTFDDSGVHYVTINVSDGSATTTERVEIYVQNINRAPVFHQMDIYVYENETYTLVPNATDPDGDPLTFTFEGYSDSSTFTPSFDDEGEHIIQVTASDGNRISFFKYTINVLNTNRPPRINTEDSFYLNEGEEFLISPDVWDPDGDEFEFIVTGWKNMSHFNTSFEDAGQYQMKIIATDYLDFSERNIKITVNNVNRPPSAFLTSVYHKEGDLVEVVPNATDPDGDELEYTFYEPLDKSGKWQTGYEDEGTYIINYMASDGEYISTNKIRIFVEDVDRPPLFQSIGDISVYEDEEARIELFAIDQDGDNVTFSMLNATEGMNLDENIFTWKPDYEFVMASQDWYHKILKFFNLYEDRKDIMVTFVAKGREESSSQTVNIKVIHKNRAPMLSDIEDITVNEGEEVIIKPDAMDPDNDKISYSYGGWINSNRYVTNYNDSGEYYVYVNASDGKKSQAITVKVTVNNVNRAPASSDIGILSAVEGENFVYTLPFYDPDGDEFTISLADPPSGAYLNDNVLHYQIPYNLTRDIVNLTFRLSDGYMESIQSIPIHIGQVNRPPVIKRSSPESEKIRVLEGATVVFEVQSFDPDGDNLSHTYSFNWLDRYTDGQKHVRRFINTGTRKITVTISDGEMETSRDWIIEVMPGPAKKIVKKPEPEEEKKPVNALKTKVDYSSAPVGQYLITHS